MRTPNESNNATEQRRQIETLWDALKILRYEAEFHMCDGPHDDDVYAIRAGKAWATFDWIGELISLRIGLLERSLHTCSNVSVGELDRLPALLPRASHLSETCYVGPFFETRRGRELLRESQECNHKGAKCRYSPGRAPGTSRSTHVTEES